MLRADITAESLRRRQADCLPGRFGLVVTRIAEGRLDAEVTIQPWMLAPNGYLHAASVLLLADTSAGYATFAHLPEKAKNFTTIELKTNFLGTALAGARSHSTNVPRSSAGSIISEKISHSDSRTSATL